MKYIFGFLLGIVGLCIGTIVYILIEGPKKSVYELTQPKVGDSYIRKYGGVSDHRIDSGNWECVIYHNPTFRYISEGEYENEKMVLHDNAIYLECEKSRERLGKWLIEHHNYAMKKQQERIEKLEAEIEWYIKLRVQKDSALYVSPITGRPIKTEVPGPPMKRWWWNPSTKRWILMTNYQPVSLSASELDSLTRWEPVADTNIDPIRTYRGYDLKHDTLK